MKKLLLTSLFTLIFSVASNAAPGSEVENNCVIKAIKNSLPEEKVADIKVRCAAVKKNALDKRIQLEKDTAENPFSITPHRPNFILPFTYADITDAPYVGTPENNEFDNVELVFQVSIKYLAIESFLMKDLDLHLAFTSTSWWQAYNNDISSPFRETNYEPEIIFSYQKPIEFFGTTIDHSYVSINHESNGKSGDLSRGWNRIIGGLSWINDSISVGVKAWWRVPENGYNGSGRPVDDNPNIEDYLGHGELSFLWHISNEHNVSFMLRNNLNSDNKGAIKIGWSYPLSKRLKGYVEYFNGYGESLIYYDQSIKRIGIGIKLTDWL